LHRSFLLAPICLVLALAGCSGAAPPAARDTAPDAEPGRDAAAVPVDAASDPTVEPAPGPDTVDDDGDTGAEDAAADSADGDTGADTAPPDDDLDLDGLLRSQETALGTDPMRPDTDLDMVDDGHDLAPLDPARGLPPAFDARGLVLAIAALPASTPAGRTPHVAGSFNGWTQAALVAGRHGAWGLELPAAAAGESLSYKFTLGDWATEESGFRGPGANRTLVVPASPGIRASVVGGWAGVAPVAGSVVGRVDIVPGFELPQLGRSATVRVFVPADYEASGRRYPVLYMQDGQNLFDTATSAFGAEWQVDETLTVALVEGWLPGVIVVGVDNGPRRACEYSPFAGSIGCEGSPGEADAYVGFVVETLKPWVDARYRTLPGREHTGIAGSSRGGLLALYAGVTRQEVFSRVLGLSPSLLPAISGGSMAEVVRAQGRRQPMRISLDYGDAEVVFGRSATELIGAMDEVLAALAGVGFAPAELRRDVVAGAVHSEPDWARRFGAVVDWGFSP
jgi:predicted alpha/beta superfamily hydrolase